MPLRNRTSPDDGSGPAPNTLADGAWDVAPSLEQPADIEPATDIATDLPGYVVLLTTRYGRPRRRVYLDLGAARTAVARANENGLHAELVLARLTPVAADLDGEWSA
jgi:hypothetical protein